KINPCAVILSGAMMFEELGWEDVSRRIIRGVEAALQAKLVTYDIARQLPGATEVSTSTCPDQVINHLGQPMPVEILLRTDPPEAVETPLLAVAVPQGPLPKSLGALDAATGGALARPLAAKDFAGKKDETLLLHPPGPARRILLVGLGPAKELTPGRLRRAVAIAARRARALGVPDAVLHVAAEALAKVDDQPAGRALAEGLGYGAWDYRELKEPPKEPRPPLGALAVARPRPTRAF